MRRSKYLRSIAAVVLISGMADSRKSDAAQQRDQTVGRSENACVLSIASNGQVVTIHGKAVQKPHDLGFEIPGCTETVLLTYAADQDTEVSANELRRDENLARFQKYTSATYKSTKKSICMQCMKYRDVEATLIGKLEIASIPPGTTKDRAGFLRDASGKIVGKWGWGHPVPFAGYRLVIQSVSTVTARKILRPSSDKPQGT
jgi:hypothetical protein